ncbi:hypothetical protein BGU71_19295, partial [Clostridioides difficile]
NAPRLGFAICCVCATGSVFVDFAVNGHGRAELALSFCALLRRQSVSGASVGGIAEHHGDGRDAGCPPPGAPPPWTRGDDESDKAYCSHEHRP